MTNTETQDEAEEFRWVKCEGGCGDEYRPGAMKDGLCIVCRERRETEARTAARDKAFQEVLEEERQKLIHGMLDEVGWEQFKFETYEPVTKEMREALDVASRFDRVMEDLFLCGPTGCGKTHLAGAILRTRAPKLTTMVEPPPFAYARAIDILRRFRNRRNDEETLMRYYATVPLLVIDDLGAEKDTDHSNQIIYEILDRRLMGKRHGLVVTTNLGLSDMATKSGTDRSTSRLNAMCKKVYIDGPDMRMRQASRPRP